MGTGSFSFDGDPGDGTFALTSLPNFNFSFDFGGNTFGNSNITTTLSAINIIINTIGSDRSVTFSSDNSGTFGGSLDFVDDSNQLSFQPSGGTLYFSNTPAGNFFGNFAGTVSATPESVPEPASGLGLLLLGGLGIRSLIKKKTV
ncbi:hypothetical protein cce_3203 [Crocosphaera subtropica ATCC 51142]|uniref:Ice-binding protein C-terminal domain-containing protein n=1 Tax=Crocosphaera subtropica (strain ATCC 51142 / BH68) TaxID=43989 RepID=B1WXL0_CROS5|nr:PEP-CTERM sorting domain-containing protein [Crocosphaera subtropica]ACB52551.1 hypothetical protein cce_3203 [Crocosphaera subtropica ATCC 51142]